MRRHQIVDTISDTPVVIFDFDTWFTVAQGTNFSPPELREATAWSHLADGESVSASSWGDRTLNLDLNQFKGNAEDHAEVLQTLGRLMDDPRGQVFLWQDEGTVHPRFFRTKRSGMTIDDLLLLENPKRRVNLRVRAHPFAYGPPISETIEIANDPTAVTNPMSYVFPAIKGDVPAPLRLDWPALAGGSYRIVTATAAGDVAPSSPPYLIVNTVSEPSEEAGWTITDAANAFYLNGFRRRLVKTSGTLPQAVTSTFDTAMDLEPGDYRVMLRGTAPNGTTFMLTDSGGDPFHTYKVTGTAPALTWFDLGVVRLPQGQPLVGGLGGTPLLKSELALSVSLDAAAGTIDVDALMFIPAGLDRAVAGTFGPTTYTAIEAPYTLTIDSENDQAYAFYVALGDLHPGGILPVGGDFPQVVPGQKNVLYFMPSAYSSQSQAEVDSKNTPTELTYTYYPPYLYIRSATG